MFGESCCFVVFANNCFSLFQSNHDDQKWTQTLQPPCTSHPYARATPLTRSRRSFPGESSPDLYAALSLSATATSAEIKSAYRRSALLYHPDKLAQGASEEEKEESNRKFQQIGFAYAILKDEEKRKRYDSSGRTDEGFGGAKTEQGWKDYFKAVWTGEVNAKTVEEFTKKYQGTFHHTLKH